MEVVETVETVEKAVEAEGKALAVIYFKVCSDVCVCVCVCHVWVCGCCRSGAWRSRSFDGSR